MGDEIPIKERLLFQKRNLCLMCALKKNRENIFSSKLIQGSYNTYNAKSITENSTCLVVFVLDSRACFKNSSCWSVIKKTHKKAFFKGYFSPNNLNSTTCFICFLLCKIYSRNRVGQKGSIASAKGI